MPGKNYIVEVTSEERKLLKRLVKEAKVDWRFTTSDARTKLKKLYPPIE